MILIKVEKNIKLFIKKCLKMNINLYNIKYYKDYIMCKIDIENIKTITEKCYFSNIEILKYYGKYGLKRNIIKYSFDYILLIFTLIILFFISNTIIEVEVKHENKTLKENIKKVLEENDIKPYRFALSVKELNKISDKIVRDNNDTLEWLSIYRNGMKYVVSFEERIIKNEIKENKFCNIIANRNAVIKKVIAYNGEVIVERDKLVNKGDILITGSIKKDEEVKKNVCADGIVIAETWYKVSVSYPLNYVKDEKTKKRRINFKFNDNYFYKKHYKKYKEKRIFKIGAFEVVREFEIKETHNKWNKKEAIDNAKNKVKEELIKKIGDNIEIIDEKVLKENEFDSKIELEVFVSVLENIGISEYFEASDINDTN